MVDNLKISISKRLNVLMLLAGLSLGQGALFAAQSYLISKEAFDLTVKFSLAFATSIFGAMLVDAGGLVLLARKQVHAEQSESSPHEISRFFSALVIVRLLFWVIYAGCVFLYWLISIDPSRHFLLIGAIGVFPWAFNISGIFDGCRLSGLSGLSASAPYICCAVVLPFTTSLTIEQAMISSGLAYSLGVILSLVVQSTFASFLGIHPKFIRPEVGRVLTLLKEATAFQISFLPGHFSYRLQFFLASALLPVEAAALFIYGKQAASAGLQVIAFTRRTSFPDLIRRCTAAPPPGFLEIMRIQSFSLVITGALMAAMVMGPIALIEFSFFEVNETIQRSLLIISPIVISTSIFSALTQCLQAAGKFTNLSAITISSAAISVLGAMLLGNHFGAGGFVFAEAAGHLILSFVTVRMINRTRIYIKAE